MNRRNLPADLTLLEITNANKRDWSWDNVDTEDGNFWVSQGANLGDTTINLGDTYETSDDDCLYVQTACENYPEVLRRAICAEERLAVITTELDALIDALRPESGTDVRRSDVSQFLRRLVETPPEQGGCWFCYRKSDDMLFDTEFDTFLHADCLRKELAADPENPEAKIMTYLLDGGESNG